MEIPNEIIVVPPKEKKPLLKNKKRMLKILCALLVTTAWSIYTIYYPAPRQFTFQYAIPIAIMCALVFCQILFVTYLFLPFKKALLLATLVTSTLAFKKSPIITIIAYAICLPLLFLKPLQEQLK